MIIEIRNHGASDILIAVVDGLKGFPEAITAVFPLTQVQTCVVHLIRNSLEYTGWKDRKAVVAELKTIYRAATAEKAFAALEAFSEGSWGKKYPLIILIWKRAVGASHPVFAYPAEVKDYLHHQRYQESAHAASKDHQNPGPFP